MPESDVAAVANLSPDSAMAPSTRPGMRRRDLLGAGSVAGLGSVLGLGYWMREQQRQGQATQTSQRVGHLLRRAGFGPTAAEIEAATRAGLASTTENLLHPERQDDSVLESKLGLAA